MPKIFPVSLFTESFLIQGPEGWTPNGYSYLFGWNFRGFLILLLLCVLTFPSFKVLIYCSYNWNNNRAIMVEKRRELFVGSNHSWSVAPTSAPILPLPELWERLGLPHFYHLCLGKILPLPTLPSSYHPPFLQSLHSKAIQKNCWFLFSHLPFSPHFGQAFVPSSAEMPAYLLVYMFIVYLYPLQYKLLEDKCCLYSYYIPDSSCKSVCVYMYVCYVFYTQYGVRTHIPKIKSLMLYGLSQPGAPVSPIFFFAPKQGFETNL